MNKYINWALIVRITLTSFLLIGVFQPLMAQVTNSPPKLTLDRAILAAVSYDPWLQASKYQQDSLESMSIAAGTLPDPKVSLGIANIAAETFQFDQEMMTQFKVGVSQMIPRGDSLEIKQQQLKLMSEEFPFLREDRKARLTVKVAEMWLDVYKAQQSIVLIDKDRALFEQLADIAQASYASALGKTRQQDIVRAQLELTRLDDRLVRLKQQQEVGIQRLSEWIEDLFLTEYLQDSDGLPRHKKSAQLIVSEQLPSVKKFFPEDLLTNNKLSSQKLSEYLFDHPALMALEQKIKVSQNGIKLAKQNYKPAWGISAGYGYRADDALGRERADLFSVGLSFDIPLFTANRQDKQVRSAISESSAIKTNKWMALRKMIASVEGYRAQLNRLIERRNLYSGKLLPQMHDQVEASLTAYTNDDGDFAEVVRSKIAELNATIDALAIDVDIQKNIVQLNYYFMNNYQDIISQKVTQSDFLGELK